MRLARACLLLAAARALQPTARTTRLRAPVPSVARRTTILRAEAEEANVGTAVRNIAPWLLFVLVGTIPRSNQFFASTSTPSSCHTQPTGRPTQSRRCASRTTRSASPRRATRPARTCFRSSSGSTSTASTSQPSEMATSALVRLCIYVPGTFYCNPFSLCGIATPSHRCSYGSTTRRLVRRPKFDFHAGLSPSSTP